MFGKNPRAAERVARSEGLEIVDVEWKVGKAAVPAGVHRQVPGGREAVKALGDRRACQHAEANGGD